MEKLVFLIQAHQSVVFAKWVKEYIGPFSTVAESELKLKGMQRRSLGNLDGELNTSIDALRKMAIEQVKKQMKNQPVIAFGFEKTLVEKSGIENYRYIEERQGLKNAQDAVLHEKNGVVFLADSYRVGVDLKFKKDAYVVILHNSNRLEGEDALQMLGRGSRAVTGNYFGALYMLGLPQDKPAVFRQLEEHNEPEFYDFSQLLSILRAVYDQKDMSALCSGLIGAFQESERGMRKLGDVKEDLGKKAKTLLAEAINQQVAQAELVKKEQLNGPTESDDDIF